MALTDPYATLTGLKAYLGVSDTVDDFRMRSALATATSGITIVCERNFNDAGVASPRVYSPKTVKRLVTDDFSTVTGLLVAGDAHGDEIYESVWTSVDYRVEPRNGVVDGEPGWPYWRLVSQQGRWWPEWVQVTARWGWAAVPAPIHEACLLMASELFKLRDAPFGVAGFDQWGAVRVRANPMAMTLISRYMKSALMVA